ncbi:hypothetical protein N0V87_008166 [Didymella glomerata]|uniref:Uncharacterized protein n=1 Tax=Didymella glomerata TaxID=749621 RepID=A0A9W8WTI9_9PLEO|nr:hypothetical protein N0V87_008166 [Didymella glomerata]
MSSQEGGSQPDGNGAKFKDPFVTDAVFGISLPPSSNILAPSNPELESPQYGLYDEIGPLDIYPIPTPHYATSATPSTRYAESPGAFSISSTATSMTSYSPATAISKPAYRVRQVSPLESRPPVSRHRTPDEPSIRTTHGLSTVRESSTSSSSASTVVTETGKVEARKQLPATHKLCRIKICVSVCGEISYGCSDQAVLAQSLSCTYVEYSYHIQRAEARNNTGRSKAKRHTTLEYVTNSGPSSKSE